MVIHLQQLATILWERICKVTDQINCQSSIKIATLAKRKVKIMCLPPAVVYCEASEFAKKEHEI